ncbi:MAG: hypothetical protein ACLQF1_10735, partial [Methyloceanibacter sp.]
MCVGQDECCRFLTVTADVGEPHYAQVPWRIVTRIGMPPFGSSTTRETGIGSCPGGLSNRAARTNVASM